MATTGISRIFKLFWGSNGQALYSNLMIPNWLWEGDAIETETRLNNQIGRGNLPQFLNTLNAYLWQYGVPNYSKLMSRNFRENMPNHYVFGQFITHKLTSNNGFKEIGSLWQNTLNKPVLFSFSNQVKRNLVYKLTNMSNRSCKNNWIRSDKKRLILLTLLFHLKSKVDLQAMTIHKV